MSDSKGAAIDGLTKHMVDRFLGWRLPEDFQPDNGISFQPTYKGLNGPMKCNPVGTNLFTATQATEMVKYMLDDAILAILAQEVNITQDRWKSDILSGFKPICSYCGIKSRKVVGQTTKGEHAQKDNHLPRNWGYYCQRCYDEGMEMEREAMYG